MNSLLATVLYTRDKCVLSRTTSPLAGSSDAVTTNFLSNEIVTSQELISKANSRTSGVTEATILVDQHQVARIRNIEAVQPEPTQKHVKKLRIGGNQSNNGGNSCQSSIVHSTTTEFTSKNKGTSQLNDSGASYLERKQPVNVSSGNQPYQASPASLRSTEKRTSPKNSSL